MIDEGIVREKISLITRDLERLKVFSNSSFAKEGEDYIKYAALKNMLMEIIGRAVDVNYHIVSEHIAPEKEAPKNYKDVFLMLYDVGVLPEEFAKEIAQTAGLRSAIVHEYNSVEESEVYELMGSFIDQYARYCKYVLRFLDKKIN